MSDGAASLHLPLGGCVPWTRTAVALSSLGFPAAAGPALLSEAHSVTGRLWFLGGAGDHHPTWTGVLGCAGTSSREGTRGSGLLWGRGQGKTQAA